MQASHPLFHPTHAGAAGVKMTSTGREANGVSLPCTSGVVFEAFVQGQEDAFGQEKALRCAPARNGVRRTSLDAAAAIKHRHRAYHGAVPVAVPVPVLELLSLQ